MKTCASVSTEVPMDRERREMRSGPSTEVFGTSDRRKAEAKIERHECRRKSWSKGQGGCGCRGGGESRRQWNPLSKDEGGKLTSASKDAYRLRLRAEICIKACR